MTPPDRTFRFQDAHNLESTHGCLCESLSLSLSLSSRLPLLYSLYQYTFVHILWTIPVSYTRAATRIETDSLASNQPTNKETDSLDALQSIVFPLRLLYIFPIQHFITRGTRPQQHQGRTIILLHIGAIHTPRVPLPSAPSPPSLIPGRPSIEGSASPPLSVRRVLPRLLSFIRFSRRALSP